MGRSTRWADQHADRGVDGDGCAINTKYRSMRCIGPHNIADSFNIHGQGLIEV